MHPALKFIALGAAAGYLTDQLEGSEFFKSNIGSVATGDLMSSLVKYGTLGVVVWLGAKYILKDSKAGGTA